MSQPQQPRNNIQGEPLDIDILLDFATIDAEDIESAKEWWDTNVTDERWIGALDIKPIEA